MCRWKGPIISKGSFLRVQYFSFFENAHLRTGFSAKRLCNLLILCHKKSADFAILGKELVEEAVVILFIAFRSFRYPPCVWLLKLSIRIETEELFHRFINHNKMYSSKLQPYHSIKIEICQGGREFQYAAAKVHFMLELSMCELSRFFLI